jgi:hypothetical protein
MIKRGRKVIGSAAIALVHADYIHSRRETFGGQSDRVSGIAGTLQAMNHQQSQSGTSIFLPMAVAEGGNARFHFDKTLLGTRQMQPAQEEKTGERLPVPTPQQTAGPEWFAGLR